MINHFTLQGRGLQLRSARIWPGNLGEMPPVCAAEPFVFGTITGGSLLL